jgi:DNA-binding SARP family transcriptional activator
MDDERVWSPQSSPYRAAIEGVPSSSVLEFRILGPLEVVDDRGPLRLGGPRQRATLAILLLDANRVVSIERLADDLYAGAPPATAVAQVQRQISELRKTLGPEPVIETRAPGYALRLVPGQLDLARFELGAEAAVRALAGGRTERAAELLRDALALWRGAPLADLSREPFAAPAIERLIEIHLAALERRIEAELDLGRHSGLVAELEQLVSEHPFREAFRRQLMLALYRSGRQSDALEVYRRTRQALADEFGIEPTAGLRKLERAILTQDLSLEAAAPPGRVPASAVLVAPANDGGFDGLLAIAEPLAGVDGRELILVRLLGELDELESATAVLHGRRASLAVPCRTAAFTTSDAARDVVRVATSYDVDLVLLDAPSDLDAAPLPTELAGILDRSPADVAVLVGSSATPLNGPLFVPFGGGEHDWAALELAAWLCSCTGGSLRVVGTDADPRHRRRDASRLLADASLAVQRVVGVDAEPLLVEPRPEALAAAVEPAGLVATGISPRWKAEGIGDSRRALVRAVRTPLLLVHRGPRPGGLAPRDSRTRFSWSIEAGG